MYLFLIEPMFFPGFPLCTAATSTPATGLKWQTPQTGDAVNRTGGGFGFGGPATPAAGIVQFLS